MPTDPNQINVAYIKHISDDQRSEGVDEIMTAHAIQLLKADAPGTPPTIIEFSNGDLVDGIYTLPYESGIPILYVVVADDNGDEVKVSPYFDPDGHYVSIDLSAMGVIDGVWTASVWTALGPNPKIPPLPISGSEADFMRIWSEEPIPLDAVADFILYTIPAGRSFCLRDVNFLVTQCGVIATSPEVTIDIAGVKILIDQEKLPQQRSDYKPYPAPVEPITYPYQLYPNHRYNLQVKEDELTVAEEGQQIRLRVITPAITIGDSLIAIVNLMGYLV